ncbi:DUF1254 domain-containing protein [Singulisphaera rosea]
MNRRAAQAGIEALEGRALLTASSVTKPAAIEALAAEAYLGGLAPEFDKRFSTYNSYVRAPLNTLDYGSAPPAWNNQATNAVDSSVLHINAFTSFKKTQALVLTVPPSNDQYYVVNYLNTVGSIGNRTTPFVSPTSYLLVGPNSPYAKMQTVNIHGFQYRVMASDTNLNWMLIRIATNTLASSSDAQSVPNVSKDTVQQFALNTLSQFQKNGHQPVYPSSYSFESTTRDVLKAAPYKNTPKSALRFFQQLGSSVK